MDCLALREHVRRLFPRRLLRRQPLDSRALFRMRPSSEQRCWLRIILYDKAWVYTYIYLYFRETLYSAPSTQYASGIVISTADPKASTLWMGRTLKLPGLPFTRQLPSSTVRPPLVSRTCQCQGHSNNKQMVRHPEANYLIIVPPPPNNKTKEHGSFAHQDPFAQRRHVPKAQPSLSLEDLPIKVDPKIQRKGRRPAFIEIGEG